MKRIILWVSISLNLLAGLWLIHKLQPRNATEASISYNPITYSNMWNGARESVLEPLSIDSTDIVFVGNSITEGFPVQEMFHSLHVKNRGIGWNRSCHIVERIGRIAARRPAKIFLDVGINDFLLHESLDTLKNNYQKIINIIFTESPDTRIYIQSVFPLGRKRASDEKTVEQFNCWLQDFCKQTELPYIDLFKAFCKDGLMDPDYTTDDIHLNGKGYQVWKREIMGYIFKPALTMLDN